MTESDLQIQVANYLRTQYPDIVFHSDFGSGIKLTMGQAVKQKRQNGSRRAWPDMFIAEPNGAYHGLFLELKRDGVKVHKKNGELVADKHIREQAEILDLLQHKGYEARFAIGFDELLVLTKQSL